MTATATATDMVAATDPLAGMFDPLAPQASATAGCCCMTAGKCSYCLAGSPSVYAIWALGPNVLAWIRGAVGYLFDWFGVNNCGASGGCFWYATTTWADLYGNFTTHAAGLQINADGSASLGMRTTIYTNYYGGCYYEMTYKTPPGVAWDCTGQNVLVFDSATFGPPYGYPCNQPTPTDPTVLVQPAPPPYDQCYVPPPGD